MFATETKTEVIILATFHFVFGNVSNFDKYYQIEIVDNYSDFNWLSLYYTIPNFNDPKEGVFKKKNCGKRSKCWLPALSPFPTVCSTLSKTHK